jgi:rod shape-determining protein MreC
VDLFLRYRNVALLITALFLQLVLLGYQVRQEDGSTLLSTWTVGVLAPFNQALHGGIDYGVSGWREYVWLVGARTENEQLQSELGTLRLQKQALERELGRLERSASLVDYQASAPARTVLAEVVGGGASGLAKEIIIDKGSTDGVLAGMAVITAEGIVGHVQTAHSASALVVLINDVDAAMGALLGDTRVRGVLRGLGDRDCELNYINTDVPVRVGEIVYSSGADRIFPKGLPIGEVVQYDRTEATQTILVRPFAALDRLDEVLVVTEGAHQSLPQRGDVPEQPTVLLPAPSETGEQPTTAAAPDSVPLDFNITDADRVRRQYQRIGEAQGHVFGEGLPGSRPPNFNLPLNEDAPVGAERRQP